MDESNERIEKIKSPPRSSWNIGLSSWNKGLSSWNKGMRGIHHHSEETLTKMRGRTPWNKGKTGVQHHSETTRKKMSISHMDHPVLIATREKIRVAQEGKPRKGTPCTIERKQKIGDANRGERCGTWKGGISFEPYCVKFNREFKERVRAFFGHECVECHMTTEENGRALDVHHVNYDKMMCCNDVKPLFVSLCKSHNAKANSNRDYWENHYTDIINEQYGGQCYLPRETL
jgi:hypothetical protein